MKTETYRLYSRAFWIFLPNIVKIFPYHFELYRFKVGPFLRHSVVLSSVCVHLYFTSPYGAGVLPPDPETASWSKHKYM